ncbi:MAG: hypothetical protein GC179_00515 [Anaerolineaceae bacterium]|nr:hypothetical protein [Anaerolineaceae bacterium]
MIGSRVRVSRFSRYFLTGLVIVVTLFLMLYHLSDFPVDWYDEGSHLHVAKNFALNGVYADSSSEGYRPFGPAVGVGPTVMLPIAALFRFVQVSIPLARLLIAVYSLLTLLLIYIITLRMASWPYALLAVVLVLTTSSIRYLYYSRTVVGEAPGMFFFLLGLALWLHPRGRSIPALLAVGILIGLGAITKNQYAFFMLPGLLVCWIADLVWYKQRGWRYFVIPGLISGLIFGAWLYISIIKLGQGSDFAENLATLRTASMGALIVMDKDSLPRVAEVLTSTKLFGALFIPALIYAIVTSLPKDEQGQNRGIIAIFVLVSTLLYAVSLGWDRYAFGPVVLIVFFVVLFVRDLVSLIKIDLSGFWKSTNDHKMSTSLVIGALLVSWIVIAVIIPFYKRFNDVLTSDNTASYEAAEWIEGNIPKSAVIETWEQSMSVLTDNTFHYPPQLILAYSVAEQWQNGEQANKFYDFRDYVDPDYVLVGPIGVYTHLYPDDHLTDYELIKTIGAYQIYRHRG